MEVKYTPQGEPGKTCADCKFYTPIPENLVSSLQTVRLGRGTIW